MVRKLKGSKKNNRRLLILIAIVIGVPFLAYLSFTVLNPNANGLFTASVFSTVPRGPVDCADTNSEIKDPNSFCGMLFGGSDKFSETPEWDFGGWHGYFVTYPDDVQCSQQRIDVTIHIPGGIVQRAIWTGYNYRFEDVELQPLTFSHTVYPVTDYGAGGYGAQRFYFFPSIFHDELPGEYNADVTRYNCDGSVRSQDLYTYFHLVQPTQEEPPQNDTTGDTEQPEPIVIPTENKPDYLKIGFSLLIIVFGVVILILIYNSRR